MFIFTNIPPKRKFIVSPDGQLAKRKVITMEIEFAIIKRAEKGQRPSFIGKALELSRSTVGTIMKDKIRIMEHGKGMEKLLVIWLEDQNRQNSIRISLALVQEKARSIFLHYAARIESEGSCDEEFKASKGWFSRFRNRTNIHNIKIQGEADSADVAAVNEFPTKL